MFKCKGQAPKMNPGQVQNKLKWIQTAFLYFKLIERSKAIGDDYADHSHRTSLNALFWVQLKGWSVFGKSIVLVYLESTNLLQPFKSHFFRTLAFHPSWHIILNPSLCPKENRTKGQGWNFTSPAGTDIIRPKISRRKPTNPQ